MPLTRCLIILINPSHYLQYFPGVTFQTRQNLVSRTWVAKWWFRGTSSLAALSPTFKIPMRKLLKQESYFRHTKLTTCEYPCLCFPRSLRHLIQEPSQTLEQFIFYEIHQIYIDMKIAKAKANSRQVPKYFLKSELQFKGQNRAFIDFG